MKTDIHKIAELARLELSEDQAQQLAPQFEKIKEYFKQIAQVKIEQDLDEESLDASELREDKVIETDINLQFSPYVEDNLFKVPKVIDN